MLAFAATTPLNAPFWSATLGGLHGVFCGSNRVGRSVNACVYTFMMLTSWRDYLEAIRHRVNPFLAGGYDSHCQWVPSRG